ncbi:HTH-type transcriptional regulator HdfR [Shewanella aestuarii]|uniref:HTH-type transcriptional regulator HdfR n=1 Tax=Shewanella aestuarii TaxID=1028752 RepID=A0A6G9QL74_9GAMM|nr:HTH-type transcriptional regulator HdfR [Shewanella aestuarii]QIR14807.1 HTH-type transcriptional regulator HdfR [Shewanella aestuarii]
MDTDLLKTFLEVSRTRHFGKAADNLFLTRSAVSFRVKQLETILGVELFERLRNNIQPTPAGERMLGHAEAVLNAWERAKQDISLHQSQLSQLTIGTGHNIWDTYLQYFFQALHSGLKGTSLRTEVLSLPVMTKQLIERTLDIAISFDPPKLDDVEIVKLMDVELCLVSQVPNAILTDLSQLNYIKVDWGTAFNIAHAQDFTMLPVPVLHTSSARMALDFLLNNCGCAFLPKTFVQPYLESRQLFVVTDAKIISRNIYAAYWASNERGAQIKQALQLLQSL